MLGTHQQIIPCPKSPSRQCYSLMLPLHRMEIVMVTSCVEIFCVWSKTGACVGAPTHKISSWDIWSCFVMIDMVAMGGGSWGVKNIVAYKMDDGIIKLVNMNCHKWWQYLGKCICSAPTLGLSKSSSLAQRSDLIWIEWISWVNLKRTTQQIKTIGIG